MIKHNRAIALLIIMALVLVFCFGCGGEVKNEPQSNVDDDVVNNEDNQTESQMTTSDVAQYILDNVEFKDQMSSISLNLFLGLYNLEEDVVTEATVYESTGATSEEIAVIRVDSDEALQQVRTAVDERIASQKASFENYVPEELNKLNDPVIVEKEKTIVFIVCNDSKDAKKLLEDMNK